LQKKVDSDPCFGEPDPLLTPHPDYLALSADPAIRQQRYREMVMATVDAEEVDAIRRHLQRQHPYGPDRFRRAIEAQLGRTVGPQKIGRPRKPVAEGGESRL
jgi:putative transposase